MVAYHELYARIRQPPVSFIGLFSGFAFHFDVV